MRIYLPSIFENVCPVSRMGFHSLLRANRALEDLSNCGASIGEADPTEKLCSDFVLSWQLYAPARLPYAKAAS